MRALPNALLLVTLIGALPGSAFAQTLAPVDAVKKAAEAAAGRIVQVEEFWINPATGWMGVEGHGADGQRYEVVMDPAGKVVRTERDGGKSYPIGFAVAVDAAAKAGVAKFKEIGLSTDGRWVFEGTDAAGKPIYLSIDAASGAVTKLGS
jgi:hypothetical protein